MSLITCSSARHAGALLFHMLSKLYECTIVLIVTNLSFSGWAMVFGDARTTTVVTSLIPEITDSTSKQVEPLHPAKTRREHALDPSMMQKSHNERWVTFQ